MPLADHVSAFFEAHGLRERGVVGVSGGLDSTVLLHALHAAGMEIEALHVNYGLRGEASEADMRFVEEMAAGLGVPARTHIVAPESIPPRSRQSWARGVRYDWFGEIADEHGIGWVAVAHHADDQAETVLMSLLRGTGVAGLAGMRPVRRLAKGADVRLVRPLLDLPRAALLGYARTHGLRWRDDASNEDVRYRRAWLRTRLMPLLREQFGDDVAARIAHTATLARAHVVEAWQAQRDALNARAITPGGLRLDALESLDVRARGRLLLDALEHFLPAAPRSAATARQLDALVHAQVGKRVDFAAGTVWRERGLLRFEPSLERRFPDFALLHPGEAVELPGGRIEASAIEDAPAVFSCAETECWLDADAAAWPLAVRRWQPGDRMQPLGMQGHKKISDLLTDARWPAGLKNRALVVCSAETVLWVPGVRRAEEAKLRPQTRRAVRLRWTQDA